MYTTTTTSYLLEEAKFLEHLEVGFADADACVRHNESKDALLVLLIKSDDGTCNVDVTLHGKLGSIRYQIGLRSHCLTYQRSKKGSIVITAAASAAAAATHQHLRESYHV